jgi:hypothetical protein
MWCPKMPSLPDYIKIKNENGEEEIFYSLAYHDIPKEFKAVAENELNETEENKAKGIKKLRKFIKKEKLPEVDDNTLIVVLRICKYNFTKSQTKLKKFLRARESLISKVEQLDLKKVEMMLEDDGIGALPYRDRHGRVIIYTRPEVMNEDIYSMDHLLLTGVALAMIILSYPLTSIAGIAYIGDGKFRNSASYLSLIKSYHHYMWTFLDLPIRLGRVDIIREHFITKWFFNIVRPFISAKILNRVSFHGKDLEDLKNLYHPDILPETFGGHAKSIDTAFFKETALEYIKMLKVESQKMKEKAK